MSDHLLRMCGLTKDKVQSMMSKVAVRQPSRNSAFMNDKHNRLRCAYEMIKSGKRIDKAAVSYCVSVKDITLFAKQNNLTTPTDIPGVIPMCKSYQAYCKALQIGVSKASREIGVSRRAVYAFAERYDLETPYRA